MSKSLLIASLLALPGCMAAKYTLADTYNGTNFFSKFDFFTGGDPTDGWVDYVDYDTAVASNLIPQTNVANWGVDIVNSLNPSSSAGRPSIRLTSKATYNHGLFIADIQHMPSSTCGLWVSAFPQIPAVFADLCSPHTGSSVRTATGPTAASSMSSRE